MLRLAMIYLVELWKRFWFQEISPYPLALFRVLFGCYLLIYFLGSSSNISLFYSNEGVYCPFLIPDIAPDRSVAVLLYAVTVVLMIALTVGYRVRVTAPLTALFYLYHFSLNIWVRACSYDRLILLALLLLCLAPSDQVLSVSRRTSPNDPNPKSSAWAVRILALHLSLFYLSTGIYKMLSPDWQTGEMIKGVMSSEFSSDFAFAVMRWNLPSFIFDLMARSVIIFELMCPVAFFIQDFTIKLAFSQKALEVRGVQYIFFALGLFFHMGIALFMQIPQFFICPVFYVLFIPGEEIERHLNFVKGFASSRLRPVLSRMVIEGNSQ